MGGKIRFLAERLSRGIVFSARLPVQFGRRRIYLSPANHLAVLKPGVRRFEAYLLGFAERFVRPGSVVWDFGANMGMFAIPAATHAKFTLAIEPDPFNQLLLHRSRKANPDLALEVLPAAISNEVGTARFAIPERGRSANSLEATSYSTQMGGTRQFFTVVTVTVDWILERYPAPDFVKIDVEGAELFLLQGASKLLSGPRPAMVIEMSSQNAKGCAAILSSNDYLMFSSYDPVDPAKAVSDIAKIWDVLAIPREKIDQFNGA